MIKKLCAQGYEYSGPLEFDSDSIKLYLENNLFDEKNALLKNLIELSEIDFHKKCASNQREAYNFQRSDPAFLEDCLVIEADYKEKIIVGDSVRQVGIFLL
jgi:hypothetical protein